MNLEHIYMFNGCLYYDPNNLMYLEPIKQFIGAENIKQFFMLFDEADDKPLMQIDKKTGIATLAITGALMPQDNFFTRMIGGTSTNRIMQAFKDAIVDDGIKGLKIIANSGGGSAAGIDEAAGLLAELASHKPVITQTTGANCSACFYITSQSTRIFANNRSDMIGSIGTKLIMEDSSERAAMEGIKVLVIATGENKAIGAEGVPITPSQLKVVEDMVFKLQEFFEETITTARTQINIEEVNDGRSFFAMEAEQLGLIDGIRDNRTINAMLEGMVSQS